MKEGERSAPVDKGKGKAEDVKDLPGGKKTQKDEKQQANGKKKGDEPQEGRSSWSRGKHVNTHDGHLADMIPPSRGAQ